MTWDVHGSVVPSSEARRAKGMRSMGVKEGAGPAPTCIETQEKIWEPKQPETQAHNVKGML